MSRRLERLLEIDHLIRANARQTAGSLAQAVERSERTVRKDIEFLRDRYHAPLSYSKTKGYHYTDPEWRLPSISLSKGELFALTLGARMLESCAGSSYKEELQSAIARLAERLPEQTWVDLQQLANENVLFRVGAELDLDPEVWQVLESACQLKQRVEMRYYTAGRNDETVRQLDPYVLHFTRNNPYVTGFCHKRQMVRWFRVDRVRSIRLLNERFEVDPAFDRQKHFEDVFQQEVGEKAHEVAIWFDAQTAPYIRERRWHPTQLVEEGQDGTLILRITVRGLNELKRWILFYGKGAIALEPPELVQMIQDEISTMYPPLYGGTVMIQALQRLMTFEEFLDWYPEDGNCYELMDGEVISVRPRGEHEEVISLLTRKLDREVERLDLPWFIPKTCCVKPEGNLDGYVPDLIVLDRAQLKSEPLWKKASTITRGASARLVVEVASTNWQDDYAKKLEDYELLGIPEYWIVDYRALGGRRYIGSPKVPTVSVYVLVDGVYQVRQFRAEDAISSAIFPALRLTATEILTVAE